MMTLNPFVENNKARINKFLNDLCEVGDFYESLEVNLMALVSFAQSLHLSLVNDLLLTCSVTIL